MESVGELLKGLTPAQRALLFGLPLAVFLALGRRRVPLPPNYISPTRFKPTYTGKVSDKFECYERNRAAKRKIIICGAGPTGSAAALYFLKRGYEVELYERRGAGDAVQLLRAVTMSSHGFFALGELGFNMDEILKISVPLNHHHYNMDGMDRYKDFPGGVSVDRGRLCDRLVELASEWPTFKMFWDHRAVSCDLEKKSVTFDHKGTTVVATGDWIMSADGWTSVGRRAMQRHTERFSFSQEYHPYGYKILVTPGADKMGWEYDMMHLMIGTIPRQIFAFNNKFINRDTLVGTLTLPWDSTQKFHLGMKDPALVTEFFQTKLPNLYKTYPGIVDEFFRAPASPLVLINCSTYHHKDAAIIAGDAAHATVPFVGQGMNVCLEDMYVLNQLMDKHNDDPKGAFPEYSRLRKLEGEACQSISKQNWNFIVGSKWRVMYLRLMHFLLPGFYSPHMDDMMDVMPFSYVLKVKEDYKRWYYIARV